MHNKLCLFWQYLYHNKTIYKIYGTYTKTTHVFFPKALFCCALVIGPIPGTEWHWRDSCGPQVTRSCEGSVGIGTMLLDGTLRDLGSIAGRLCFLLRNVHTVPRAYPVCCPVGTDALTPRVKWPEHEHSPTCDAEVMNVWSCTSTLMWRLHGVDGDN